MREGDWGEVVRLMREEREGAASIPIAQPMPDSERPMPFHERFDTVRITPQKVADSVVEENGRFKALSIEGEQYKPSRRFLKGMAQRMKVPLGVFELFTPLEVIRRAAERAPDLPLRLTVDREDRQALALIEDKGIPIPAGNIEIIMKEDTRLQAFNYHDGVITGRFDLGEAWDIPNDSKYGVPSQRRCLWMAWERQRPRLPLGDKSAPMVRSPKLRCSARKWKSRTTAAYISADFCGRSTTRAAWSICTSG